MDGDCNIKQSTLPASLMGNPCSWMTREPIKATLAATLMETTATWRSQMDTASWMPSIP